MLQQFRAMSERWIQHQRQPKRRTLAWACMYCLNTKLFLSGDELFEHRKSVHQDRSGVQKATIERMPRLRAKSEVSSFTERPHTPSSRVFNTEGSHFHPDPTQSPWHLRELSIVIPNPGEDVSTVDIFDDSHGVVGQRKGVALENRLFADSMSSFGEGSASPPRRGPNWRPISVSGPRGIEAESQQPSLFGTQQPNLEVTRVWAPDQNGPLPTTVFDLFTINYFEAHLGESPSGGYKWSNPFLETTTSRHPLTQHAQNLKFPSTGSAKATPAEMSIPAPNDDTPELILQPESRPISREQLVAEVKAIYAGLVMVEAKCIEVEDEKAALLQSDRAYPRLNNEQWQAMISLNRTLLHEHYDFFVASQHPSASPVLRRSASKYAIPARKWRHDMLSFLESLKTRSPASLDDIRHKLTFMELAYTMMDLLHEMKPRIWDTWSKCLANFNHHASLIQKSFHDTTGWTDVLRQWYLDVSNDFSKLLPYLPKLYTKSPSFFRKAIWISVNGKQYLARPDSGSEENVCSEAFANQGGLHISQKVEDKILFQLGTKTQVRSIGRILVSCGLPSDGNPAEKRWFCVLKECVAPIIMGERFLRDIELYEKNKHLLVTCPNWFRSLPTLKYIGCPNSWILFQAGGYTLNACADTGSDEDFMSLECARKYGLKIDSRPSKRVVIQQADASIVKTVGQVRVSVKVGCMDEFQMTFHVLRDLCCEVIFCEEFLEQTDAFTYLVESTDSFLDADVGSREVLRALNTLVNLGPINAYLNRTRTMGLSNSTQQVHEQHDNAIVAEIYRRNKVKKFLIRISDERERHIAEEVEGVRKNNFDLSHADCAICIQRSNHEPAPASY